MTQSVIVAVVVLAWVYFAPRIGRYLAEWARATGRNPDKWQLFGKLGSIVLLIAFLVVIGRRKQWPTKSPSRR